jgi:hypothetical protein
VSAQQLDDPPPSQELLKSPKRLGLAEWLSIVQLLALLTGGAWAGFQFWKFDARDKELAFQRAQIELQKLRANPLDVSPDLSSIMWTLS